MLHHPKLEEARRLLDCAPTIDLIDIQDDDIRYIANMHALRRLAEEATERLIDFLDEIDAPNEDLEPSLGYTPPGNAVDAEGPDDNGVGDADGAAEQMQGEPSLGWTAGINQLGAQWRGKPPSLFSDSPIIEDGEQEFDGREEDDAGEDGGDEEPSLGSIEVGILWSCGWSGSLSYGRVGIDQRDWGAWGSDKDLEGDDFDSEESDNGIGDAGGLLFDDEADDNGIADEGGLQEQSSQLFPAI